MSRNITDVFRDIATWGDPDDVAEKLRSLGMKGKPDCAEACPMAIYILSQTDGSEVTELEVNGWNTYYADEHHFWEDIDNPDNMSEFVERFDGGEYPFLRQEEEKQEIPDPPTDPDQYPLW